MSGQRIIKTACRNCHGGCIANLYIEDGKIVKIRPDPDSPLSRGRMCIKGLNGLELLYNQDRLKQPLKRAGKRGEGKWEEIGWDEAYDIIAENITKITDKFGRESIAIAQGTGRHHLNQTIRFANTLGTPNWVEPGFAQCFFPRVNICKLTMGGLHIPDYYGDINPECILVWGHNHIVSGPSGESQFLIRDAIAKGSKLIVVDPRRTELAEKADVWLKIRPGTDAALALAIINIIISEGLYDSKFIDNWAYGFEELKTRAAEYTLDKVSSITWVPKEQIVEAAHLFAKAKPATLEWGVAIEHTTNCIQAVRSVSLLPAITGNLDIPGGWIKGMNILPPPGSNIERLSEKTRMKRIGADDYKLLSGMNAVNPAAHIPTLFEAMRTGKPYPVRMLMMFGNNGLISFADTKKTYDTLLGLDFICALDMFMTPTAELADLVMPAASWMELDEIVGMPVLASNTILTTVKAVRTNQCRSDEEVFFEICKKIGLDWGADSPEDLLNKQLSEASKHFEGIENLDFEEMKKRTYISVPIKYKKYERSGFDTPTGKVELYSTVLKKLGYDPLPGYVEPPETIYSKPELAKDFPLTLTTGGRIQNFFCSENRQMPTLRKGHPYPIVEIHPKTAAEQGISNGDWVYIESPRGRITQKAKVTDGIDPRVINCEYGWWYPEIKTPDHGVWISNVNLLTSMEPPYDPMMGTYQLRALLCKIYKNTDGIPKGILDV